MAADASWRGVLGYRNQTPLFYFIYYQEDARRDEPLPGQIAMFRHKWEKLSEFMKEIKQTFSRYYNKRYKRRGFFWSNRFKSVLVENGETLINCLAYVDLNPIRARLIGRPDDYRWSSLGYHYQTGNKNQFLSLDFGLKLKAEEDNADKKPVRILGLQGMFSLKRLSEDRSA